MQTIEDWAVGLMRDTLEGDGVSERIIRIVEQEGRRQFAEHLPDGMAQIKASPGLRRTLAPAILELAQTVRREAQVMERAASAGGGDT